MTGGSKTVPALPPSGSSAGRLAELTQALADLTLGTDSGSAMVEAVRAAVPQLSLPPRPPGLLRRLWGRVPGEIPDNTPALAAMVRRLESLIAHAEGRIVTIGWIAARAEALPITDESLRLQLLAAARTAAEAERQAAAWGRHFIDTTLPLWRATQNAAARHAILAAALKPEDR